VSRLVVVGGTVLALLLLGALSASAATINVTQTADTTGGACTVDSCSLRQAVAAVGNGDTIELPADGAHPYAVTQGELVLTKSATIACGFCVIQVQGVGRALRIASNPAAVRLDGLTITDGQASGDGGGGIEADGPGPLFLSGVTVTGNHVTPAASGSDQGGGGIRSRVSLTLADSAVSGNTVDVSQSAGDSGGGGILMTGGDLTLDNSTVSGNTATVSPVTMEALDDNGGGGIYNGAGNLTLRRSLVQGNTADVATAAPASTTPADGGGGIYQSGTSLQLRDSTIAGNIANGPGIAKSGGGGVLDAGDTSQYVDSTITGNRTGEPAASTGGLLDTDGGGAILFDAVSGGVTMANTTVSDNSAPEASGGAINSVLDTEVEMTNSIVAGNTDNTNPTGPGANCKGPISSLGYNLTDDPAGADTCAFTATGDLVSLSPGLRPLESGSDYSGNPPPTQALTQGSPAIDAGDPAGCTDLLGNQLAVDERGVTRDPPAGARCDIGAVESAVPKELADTATVDASGVSFRVTFQNPVSAYSGVHGFFEYGPTTDFGSQIDALPPFPIGGPLPFGGRELDAGPLTGLAPGTYFFRSRVTNHDGTTMGFGGTFTVPAVATSPPPAVSPRPASRIAPYSALLTSAVNPQGQATTMHFEYGSTTAYGTRTPEHPVGAGSTPVSFSATITGLLPGHTYHYRAVAQNPAGKTSATDATFHTAPRPRPSSLTAGATPHTDKTAPYRFTIGGTMRPPAGITRARACRGPITIEATLNHTTIAIAHTTLKPTCRYTTRLTLRRRPRLARIGHPRITTTFRGTSVLAPRTAGALGVTFG
jgi:hypothetical protein